MTDYKVTIKNESGDTTNPRVYYIFSQLPVVSGGGVAAASQLQWAKTKPLGNNAQSVFKYTSETFGFVGYCNTSTSVDMKPGTEITINTSLPVSVGTFRSDGTVLYVKETNDNISIIDIGKNNSSNGTFTISCDAQIPNPSKYVVGVARKSEQTGIAPVAAIECKPGSDYIFTPQQGIFIARETQTQQDGVIINATSVFGRVDFKGNAREATVSENNNGTFSVQYK
jgi:hypothetical protein